jgi:hypothetical protein
MVRDFVALRYFRFKFDILFLDCDRWMHQFEDYVEKSRDHPELREKISNQPPFFILSSLANPADQINPFLYFSVGQAGHSKKKHLQNFSSKIIREIFNFLFSLVKKFAILRSRF